MTITKRPTKPSTGSPAASEAQAERFIQSAPDSATAKSGVEGRKRVMRGKREQISHTLPPELLVWVDKAAQTKGLTRAGLINLALSEYLGR